MPENKEILTSFKKRGIHFREVSAFIGNYHKEDQPDSHDTCYAYDPVDSLSPRLSHDPPQEYHSETDRKEPGEILNISYADSRTREIEPGKEQCAYKCYRNETVKSHSFAFRYPAFCLHKASRRENGSQ